MMAEPLSIGAIVVAAITATMQAAPHVSRWWAERGKARSEADVARARVAEREITAQHRTDRTGIEIAARVMQAREVDHADCRKEVAALRVEVQAARSAVDDCQAKHAAAEERIDAQDSQILDLRGVLEWMKGQLDRIERRSNPPKMEPAE